MEEIARKLRKSQTDAERKLWFYLRDRQLSDLKFRRQHSILLYIVDFCCIEKRLIVELDGSQHTENQEKDNVRSAALQKRGFRILRFWNHDVLQNTASVLEAIRLELQKSPHPNPLPQTGERRRSKQ